MKKIFECITGSTAYGLRTEDSDTDTRGVFIADISNYFGLNKIEQIEDDKKDNVLYEFLKAIKLISENNPNMLELLYIPEKYIKETSEAWKKVQQNRHLFLSKRAKYKFSGYAISQLKRLKNHKSWLDKEVEKPERSQFNLPVMPNIKPEVVKNTVKLSSDFVNSYINADILDELNREAQFENALREYNNYIQWKNGRNDKRFQLEAKYGYDTKHAMHTVRLLHMGVEALLEGEVFVDRTNRDKKLLLKIRNGEWEYDRLYDYACNLEQLLDEVYYKSKLQEKCNHKKINELCRDILAEHFGYII